MANVNEDSDENEIEEADTMKNDTKQGFEKLLKNVNTVAIKTIGPGTKQLLVGAVSGWVTGYIALKVGKTVAFCVGSGVLLLQVAQNKGFVNFEWGKLKEKTEQVRKDARLDEKAPDLLKKIARFSSCNTPFATGFVGGFLIGASH